MKIGVLTVTSLSNVLLAVHILYFRYVVHYGFKLMNCANSIKYKLCVPINIHCVVPISFQQYLPSCWYHSNQHD